MKTWRQNGWSKNERIAVVIAKDGNEWKFKKVMVPRGSALV
jgi:hypothetical protein